MPDTASRLQPLQSSPVVNGADNTVVVRGLIRRMETFLNAGVTPHVHEYGSIGASGDLVPLVSITGALIGLDPSFTVDYNGQEMDALTALERLGLPPYVWVPRKVSPWSTVRR